MKIKSENPYRIRMVLKNNEPTYQVFRKIWILPIVKVFYESSDITKASIYKNNCNLISKNQ